FEQKGLPIAAAIDKDHKSAWAIDPQVGKDHAAVFETDTPLELPADAVLTFTLKFNNNTGHNLGHFRLSATDSGQPLEFFAPGMPGNIRALLRNGNSTPTERASMLKWYRTIDPGWLALHRKVEEHLGKAPQPPPAQVLVATAG